MKLLISKHINPWPVLTSDLLVSSSIIVTVVTATDPTTGDMSTSSWAVNVNNRSEKVLLPSKTVSFRMLVTTLTDVSPAEMTRGDEVTI